MSLDSPKSEWHVGQRQINEAENVLGKNTALRTILRGGVRIQTCRVAVWLMREDHSDVLIGAGGERCSAPPPVVPQEKMED